MTKFEKRAAQVCATLLSEGHILVGSVEGITFFRHPNGRRLSVIAVYPTIAIRENGKTLTEISVTPALLSRNKPEAKSR